MKTLKQTLATKKSVRCLIKGLKDRELSQKIEFTSGDDLKFLVEGNLGPSGMTNVGADLIDLAGAIFQIERQLRGRGRTNPPEKFALSIALRSPRMWTKKAISATISALNLLGDASWQIEIEPGLRAEIPKFETTQGDQVVQVALFSGGLDSTCGAYSLRDERARTQLVSFYTGQKSLQLELATAIGFSKPVQWSRKWTGDLGRGHSFRYRSFLFLALAAVVANSWKARRILQFENGILASQHSSLSSIFHDTSRASRVA